MRLHMGKWEAIHGGCAYSRVKSGHLHAERSVKPAPEDISGNAATKDATLTAEKVAASRDDAISRTFGAPSLTDSVLISNMSSPSTSGTSFIIAITEPKIAKKPAPSHDRRGNSGPPRMLAACA